MHEKYTHNVFFYIVKSVLLEVYTEEYYFSSMIRKFVGKEDEEGGRTRRLHRKRI